MYVRENGHSSAMKGAPAVVLRKDTLTRLAMYSHKHPMTCDQNAESRNARSLFLLAQ